MRLVGKIPGEATKGLSVISAHWVSFVVEQCTLIPYHVSLSETSILYYYKILFISLLILWNGQAQEFRSTPNKKQCLHSPSSSSISKSDGCRCASMRITSREIIPTGMIFLLFLPSQRKLRTSFPIAFACVYGQRVRGCVQRLENQMMEQVR